jgi:hypothetical protein
MSGERNKLRVIADWPGRSNPVGLLAAHSI